MGDGVAPVLVVERAPRGGVRREWSGRGRRNGGVGKLGLLGEKWEGGNGSLKGVIGLVNGFEEGNTSPGEDRHLGRHQ